MIYINGELVDFQNKDAHYKFHGVVKEYHSTISDLKQKHGDTVLLQTPASKPRIDPHTKRQRPPKPYSWPYKTTIIDGNNTQYWTYSKSPLQVKDGVPQIEEPNLIITRGDKTISLVEEPDLVFFLTKIRAYRRGKLWIFNPQELEDQRADDMMKESKLRDMIYSENSPLNVDVSVLKSLAAKWGVVDVDKGSLNGVRNSLYDKVLFGQKNVKNNKEGARGIQDFLDDCGGGESVQVGANIQAGLDQGSLKLNRKSGQWEIYIRAGEKPVILMSPGYVGGDEARARLMQYLLKNKEDATLLEQVVSGKARVEHGRVVEKEVQENEVVIPDDVTLDNIDEIGSDGKPVVAFKILQKAAKSLGLRPPIGTTADSLRAMVREKLEQVAQLS